MNRRAMVLTPVLAFLALGSACSDEKQGAAPATSDPHAGHAMPAAAGEQEGPLGGAHAAHIPEGYAPVEISAERLQLFGIRTEKAVRRALVREVRTVGIVRTDETLESHVHVKWMGWIEEFFVSFVGQKVQAGDPLFSVYSPELVTAEQEFLVAARRAASTKSAGRSAEIESADLLVETARRKLRLWDVPDEAVAQLEKTGEVQRLITVRAPRSGTVIEKMALPGMYVEPMMDLYTIADLARVWVLADLYEYEVPLVAVGQTANFTPIGTPPGAQELSASVTFLAPAVDPMTRTVKVRFELPNPNGSLRPGAYGTVRLQVPLAEALDVPRDAVIDTGIRTLAFVRTGAGRFEPRALRLGARAGDRVQVLEGLSEGEEIVTRAQFMLDSESRLRAAAAVGGKPGHGGH